jgi:hypothetical protein
MKTAPAIAQLLLHPVNKAQLAVVFAALQG